MLDCQALEGTGYCVVVDSIESGFKTDKERLSLYLSVRKKGLNDVKNAIFENNL